MKTNCRYYRNNTDNRGCKILKKLFCRNENCSYYKAKIETKEIKNENNRNFRSRNTI